VDGVVYEQSVDVCQVADASDELFKSLSSLVGMYKRVQTTPERVDDYTARHLLLGILNGRSIASLLNGPNLKSIHIQRVWQIVQALHSANIPHLARIMATCPPQHKYYLDKIASNERIHWLSILQRAYIQTSLAYTSQFLLFPTPDDSQAWLRLHNIRVDNNMVYYKR
jgi:hypothetical protein